MQNKNKTTFIIILYFMINYLNNPALPRVFIIIVNTLNLEFWNQTKNMVLVRGYTEFTNKNKQTEIDTLYV